MSSIHLLQQQIPPAELQGSAAARMELPRTTESNLGLSHPARARAGSLPQQQGTMTLSSIAFNTNKHYPPLFLIIISIILYYFNNN